MKKNNLSRRKFNTQIILKKNKYGNIFKVFVIMGTTFAMIIVQLIATGRVEYLKRQTLPGLCKGGLNFVAEGAGALSRSFDLCNASDWHDYILGGKCRYRGDCSLYRNTSVFFKGRNTSIYIKGDLSDVNNSNSSSRRFLHESDEHSEEENKKWEYEKKFTYNGW